MTGHKLLVRTHNAIVRKALIEFSGMASFASTTNAVKAAIMIQGEVARESLDLNLHLRIGINTSEPIREENDLFGTTV